MYSVQWFESVYQSDDFRVYCTEKTDNTLELVSYYPLSRFTTTVRMVRNADRSVDYCVFNGIGYEKTNAGAVCAFFTPSMRRPWYTMNLTTNYGYTYAQATNQVIDTKGLFKDAGEEAVARYIRDHFLPENKFILPYDDSANTILNVLEIPLMQSLLKDCVNVTNSDIHNVKKPIVELAKISSFKDAILHAFGSNGSKLTKLVASRLYTKSHVTHSVDLKDAEVPSVSNTLALGGYPYTQTGVSASTAYVTYSSPVRVEETLSLKVFNFGFLLKDLVPLDYIHDIVETANLLDLTENFNGFNGLSEVEKGQTAKIREFLKLFSPYKIKKIFLTLTQEMDLYDAVRQYQEHESKITLPEDFKDLKELHDIISRQYLKFKAENKPLVYTEEIQKIEGAVVDEDLVMTLPKDTWELFDWGHEFHNCVASYGEKALNNQVYIVGVRNKENKLKYCIEIVDNRIVQFKTHNNVEGKHEDKVKVGNFLQNFKLDTKPYDSGNTIYIPPIIGGNINTINGTVLINNNGNPTWTTIATTAASQGQVNSIQPLYGGQQLAIQGGQATAALQVLNENNGVYTIAGSNGENINVLAPDAQQNNTIRHNHVIDNLGGLT